MHYIEKDDWRVGDMLRHLRFERGRLRRGRARAAPGCRVGFGTYNEASLASVLDALEAEREFRAGGALFA